MTAPASQPKFFAARTVCPSCRYEPGSNYIDLCPECGAPLDALASFGKIIPLNAPYQPSPPITLSPKPYRYLIHFIDKPTKDLYVYFIGIALIIGALMNWAFRYTNFPDTHESLFLTLLIAVPVTLSIPIGSIIAMIYGEYKFRQANRHLAKNTILNYIEQHNLSIKRSLILNFDNDQWLLINQHADNCILFPPEQIKRLNINLDEPICSEVILDIDPNTNLILGFNSTGQAVPTRTSTTLQPRRIIRHCSMYPLNVSESIVFGKRRSPGSYFTSDR